MSLTKRLLTFGIGFIIGVIILMFFWNKKDVSFNYGPDARVISQIIKTKDQIIAPEVNEFLEVRAIDSSRFRDIIKEADVDFSKSKQHQEPCRAFYLTSVYQQEKLAFRVKLCDSLVRFNNIQKIQ